MRASLLRSTGSSTNVAVTIDDASPHDLADVLMAAHGMSRREREICHEVMAGRSTREIATLLYISPHTVQDHLKSIFDKAGVRSRRELVAALGGRAPPVERRRNTPSAVNHYGGDDSTETSTRGTRCDVAHRQYSVHYSQEWW